MAISMGTVSYNELPDFIKECLNRPLKHLPPMEGAICVKVKLPEEKPMTKEKMFEYKFKVDNEKEICVERIARENPYCEMIIAIPKESKKAYIIVDSNFNVKHGLVAVGNVNSAHLVGGYIFADIDKECISAFVNRYHEIKAKAQKPKPKQEVTVKCFGDTLPF